MKRTAVVFLLFFCLLHAASCGASSVNRTAFSPSDLPFDVETKHTYGKLSEYSVSMHTVTEEQVSERIDELIIPTADMPIPNTVNIRQNKSGDMIAVSAIDLSLNKAALTALCELADNLKNATKTDKQLLVASAYQAPGQADPQDLASGLSVSLRFFRDATYPLDNSEVSAESSYLFNNAPRFGFIVRYPDQSGQQSAAVFRYVGAVHAHYMTEHEFSLEEYVSLLKDTSAEHALTIDAPDGYRYLVYRTSANNGTLKLPQSDNVTVSRCGTSDYAVTVRVQKTPAVIPNGKTVFIDAGHGTDTGNGIIDRGAGENTLYHELTNRYEHDLNRMIAKELCRILKANGYHVIYGNDLYTAETVNVYDRANIANSSGADIFISLHANTHTDGGAYGCRVYYGNTQENSKESKKLANDFALSLNSLPGISGSKVTADTANYVVIRDTKMPAILIESCFLTNKEDVQNAADPRWITAFAMATAGGVDTYFFGK